MRAQAILIILFLSAPHANALPDRSQKPQSCVQALSSAPLPLPVQSEVERAIAEEVAERVGTACSETCTSLEAASATTQGIEKGLRRFRIPLRHARGYAILGATMVASAAATAQLTGILPENLKFLSQMVAQISTLGVFVVGAPIWEPMTSAFRKFAFDIQESRVSGASDSQFNEKLQSIWRNTQGKYSLNTQMSRNVVHSFLLAVQANFHQARVAMESGDRRLAVMQIAEAAVRMRRLFAEIPPDDESVRLMVRASFTLHMPGASDLRASVQEQISLFDPAAKDEGVRGYYEAVLTSWLSSPTSGI